MIVLAAVDGSDRTVPVVREAVRFASLLDADLHVLHVAHLTGLYYSALATALLDEQEIETKLLQAVWDRVDPLLHGVDGLVYEKVGSTLR